LCLLLSLNLHVGGLYSLDARCRVRCRIKVQS
jgi:hypothetical protein